MLVAALALSTASPSSRLGDTLAIRDVPVAPPADATLDSLAWGTPQVTIATRQGRASVWLLRSADTVFVVARVPDGTRSWADAFAICLDVDGDRAASPAHDDFEWSLRRALDSSVVYRGRDGRWQAPLGDPDWRVGRSHAGGGWEAAVADGPSGWSVVLRLDPAWFAAESGRPPGIAFQVHDDDPNGWYGWPRPDADADAETLERRPAAWATVLLPGS